MRMALCLSVLIALYAPSWGADCARTSTGLKPLDTPFFLGNYQGVTGGLYPGGANRRPADHDAAGVKLAAGVRPRSSAGTVDEQSGKLVLLSIGMSNTTAEFSAFQQLLAADSARNPQLVAVDGAIGSWSADRIVASPAEYWNQVADRLRAAGVTAAQVQAAWIKQADASPTGRFPDDARTLQAHISSIVASLPSRFPNLKLAYLSSRIYGGYASTNLNPEPYAYNSGYAVKWLIEAQIQGSPELSYTAGKAPWMAWGPYLWTDGATMRYDGLSWACADVADDGTHPSDSGRNKVAHLLLDFFKSDITSSPWFLKAVPRPPKPAAAALLNAAGFFPRAATGAMASLFGSDLASGEASAADLPLPVTLAGTRVEIGGVPANLLYVSPRQINLIVPPVVAGSSVVVYRDGVASDPFNAAIAFDTPGFFSLDGTGKGPAAALHLDARVVAPAAPAAAGETIMLFLTGKGVRDPRIAMPEYRPVIRVGGIPAEFTYFGPAPGYPGLEQLNLVIPAAAPSGPAVPLELAVGPLFTGNTVTLAIAGR